MSEDERGGELTYAEAELLYGDLKRRAALVRAPRPDRRRRVRRTRVVASGLTALAAVVAASAWWAIGAASPSPAVYRLGPSGPVYTSRRAAAGRFGNSRQLASELGFVPLIPRLSATAQAWSGPVAQLPGGWQQGLVFAYPASGLRVVEVPAGTVIPGGSPYPVRSAVFGGVLVRVVDLSGRRTPAQLAAVLRSLR